MPLIRKATESQFETIQAGTYEVTCMDVKPERWEEDVYGNYDKLRFTLEVQDMVDAEENPARLSGLCNDTLSEKSTLWSWLIAFGLSPSYDADIDVEECIGKKAMAQVSVKESKKDKSPYNKIEAMFPLPVKRGTQAAKASPTATEEADFDGFWKQVKAMGKTAEDVRLLLPGQDMRVMLEQTGADLVELLEKLSA